MTAALLLARTHWKLALVGILVALLAVQSIRLAHRGNQLERAKINLNEARAELKRISTAKDEQREETGQNIGQAERRNRDADKIAERIEGAPLPGNCATPPEILGADL